MSIGPTERQGWVERRWAARAVGAVVYLVPFTASVVAAFLLSSLLPIAPNLFIGILRWIGVAVVSTVVLVAVERQTRRLMPLRTLLGLTLAFPDKAPSRFKIAIRTGTTNQLRERLDEARRGRLGDTPSEAAERLLELVGMLSQHDRLTRGHSERVRAYSHMIGTEMGLSGRDLDRLRWAGLLHDVGKLAISPDILNKPGKLTSDEFDIIKTHPMEGKTLVEPLAGWLGDAANAVWEHHERFDGGGYPQGLAGTEISQAARIVSVADVFDVITSIRSYKAATSAREAREEIARCAGTQFDPEVVRAFLALSIGGVRRTMGPLSWAAQLAFLPGAVAAHAGPALAAAAVVTAGAAAGTVGIVVDPAPAISNPQEFVATIEGLSALPDRESNRLSLATDSTDDLVTASSVATGAPDEVDRAPADDLAASKDQIASNDDAGDPVAGDDDPDSDDVVMIADDDGPESGDRPAAPPSVTEGEGTPDTPRPTTEPDPEATTPTEPAARVTPTTSAPEIDPTTTTSTSTTTSRTTTTTTTEPPGVDGGDHLYLVPAGSGDQTSRSVLALATDRPADGPLFNYDTDRDASPGLLLAKDGAGVTGTDPTKVQRFRTSFSGVARLDSEVSVEFEVAAKDFAKKDIHVQVQLRHCNLLGLCTSLCIGDKDVRNADVFTKVRINLGEIRTLMLLGDTLELRVAILDDSEDDAWLAFGTRDHDGRIHLH